MKKTLLLLLAVIVFSLEGYSQQSKLWTLTNESTTSTLEKVNRDSTPRKFDLFHLNLDLLKNKLQNAPLRNGSGVQSNVIVDFPNAEGKIENYRVYEAPVMHAELSAKHPDIKSYVGMGIDDATATIRFSVTPFGVHTMIFSGKTGTQYMDPYTKDLQNYMVYNKQDLYTTRTFGCEVVEDGVDEMKASIDPDITVQASNGLFKTYRLAMACTIEYAAYHVNAAGLQAGTLAQKKAAVLAAMNVTMTRVNGLYEKDMSLTMVLVPTNESVIFIDSDSFNNTSASVLINQSQTVIDANIGFTNYDIGHTVSTGGGGLAQLNSPCSTSKARGITGSSAPVGDPYDIDYVAHEMGHQFGATHTFNNSCGGNRSGNTAVEPGSGTTIMAYAGICAPNVQSNSDAHFHAVSLAQMIAFVNGAGNCGVVVANNNAAPVVEAGPNYKIPKGTAFILKGQATDADNATGLTYCWEQTDTQVSTQPPIVSAVGGPNFRSLPPSLSPNRYMPALSSVLANNLAPTWEVIPATITADRVMNFALTVRDNKTPNGGQTNRDNMTVTFSGVAGPFVVTAPNTVVSWQAGTNQTVTWNVAGTTANGIDAKFVDIYLSTDGGLTFTTQLANKVPNDGSEIVMVPNVVGTTNRIMVMGYDNIFYDVSNTNFAITTPATTFSVAVSGEQNKTVCKGTNGTFDLSYLNLNGFSANTTFTVSGNPAGSAVTFSPASTNANGTVVMSVANTAASDLGFYSMTVTATSGTTTKVANVYLDLLDSNFPTMSLTSPANLAVGQSTSTIVKWTANSNASTYELQLASDSAFTTILKTETTTETSYLMAGLNEVTDYYWRVKPKNISCEGAYSTGYKFTTGQVVCQPFTSTNVPVTIAATPNTVNSTLTMTDDLIISSLKVILNITHTYVEDMTVTLISPAGMEVQLFSEVCGDNDNVNAIFDDAGTAITCGVNPGISGTVLPAQPLSALNGQSTGGVWTLRVSDPYQGDGGSINSWGLTVCAAQDPLGVEEKTIKDFVLYPNPNKGSFTVQFSSNSSEQIGISVHDISGRVIFENKYNNTGLFNQNLQLNQVQSGIYLVTVSDGARKIMKKVIVE
ncbi:reprolysin-like metallopeptidase [Flavobacterium sp. '19STA2R22 D10 B1']|uniref:zinc-dependent metalloprotease n=1 Tax=Flavobacterium aerium TaxID=3037261 RepID=UPI00278C1E4F|nr:zinc-dependent metalloprotease family protein [Flavobacterium sp. '19STA2R22 D10 B1']